MLETDWTVCLCVQTGLFAFCCQALYKPRMETLQITPEDGSRSEIMRAKLMEATLDVILREGWANASTLKICQQAGVSRGAQTHHFPTKTSLFMAAIDKIAREYEKQIITKLEALPKAKRSMRHVLEVIWQTCLDDRFMNCSIEAMVAARTDSELKDPIAALDVEAIASVRHLAHNGYMDTNLRGKKPQKNKGVLEDVIEMSLYLFRAFVIQRGMHNNQQDQQRLFAVWCDLIEKAFAES